MPNPTVNSVHLDAVLTNMSVAYMQDANNFIADKVFPVVPVSKQSDVYYTYSKADFLRDEFKKVADGAASPEAGYNLGTGTYYCDVWKLSHVIGDQRRANSDNPLDPDRDAVNFLTQQALIKRERQFVSDVFTTGVWGTDVTGGTGFTVWSDQSGSDPEVDIDTARETILKNTGLEPNTLVLGYQVYKALTRHPLVKEQYKYTSSDSITPQMLAKTFDLGNIYISRAVYNSAAEGATASYGFAAGKNALLCYVAPSVGLMTPTAGLTMSWTGMGGANVGVYRYDLRGMGRPADKIELAMAYDNKVISTDLGYFFSGAVA